GFHEDLMVVPVPVFDKGIPELVEQAPEGEAEYEASQGELVTTTWANRQSAMRDVGHRGGDFA
ncbi:MAG: hypothetical protein ABT940_14735, partial [Alphaproteobacteria bacterium]